MEQSVLCKISRLFPLALRRHMRSFHVFVIFRPEEPRLLPTPTDQLDDRPYSYFGVLGLHGVFLITKVMSQVSRWSS